MTAASELREPWDRLLDHLVEGMITSEEYSELTRQLREDAESRASYARYMSMHAMLKYELARPLESPESIPQSLMVGNGQTAVIRAVSGQRSMESRSLLLRPIFWTTLGVAILFYGGFALLNIGLRPDRWLRGTGDAVEAVAVAVVDDASTARWSAESEVPSRDASIQKGKALGIDSGKVQLQLSQGATLVIEGPARWSIEGANRASLQTGKLLARVPKSATGFTLDTPTAQIVDLGTQFSVEVDRAGESLVRVISGQVTAAARKEANRDVVGEPVRLNAGESVRISSAAEPVVESAPGSTKAEGSDSQVRRLRIEGVLASSELAPLREARYLIGDHGLTGDKHSAAHGYVMWHSALGRVKNEFVLFDLGVPRRLHSLKIWNYNEASSGRRVCGAKRIDVYVSRTGRGDPLTNRADWTKVVADRDLTMATGNENYDSPDIVLLNGAEGRFVGIVIQDHFGPDPRPEFSGPEHQCVGLSEVQIFGEAMSRSGSRKNP